MAGKKSTAIEKTSDEEKEAAALAELTDFFDGVDVDGLEDVGGESRRPDLGRRPLRLPARRIEGPSRIQDTRQPRFGTP